MQSFSGFLKSVGLKKKSEQPIINKLLKNNNNNRSVASTANLTNNGSNTKSILYNNVKINQNEINIIIDKIVTTNKIPELTRFKETWKTSSDDKKKDIIKKISKIVNNEKLINYLSTNNKKNIAKNNDTRFTTVLKLLDLLIQGHNRSRYESVQRNYSNNNNKFENLIYKLKHIDYTPGNTSKPQFTLAANQFIAAQLSRSRLPQISNLDAKQKNEFISFLVYSKYFKDLLNTFKPTKKDYFAWVDTTFVI
jgi:hypothetical protein